MKKSHIKMVLIACVWAWTACGGRQIPKAPKCDIAGLSVEITTADRLNMGEGGNSLSLVMRIYQLKTSAALEEADFELMWQNPEAALGEDLLSTTEITVFPGKTEVRDLPRAPEARFVGVMGVFRKQTGTTWRAWKQIRPATRFECKRNDEPTRKFIFNVSDYHVEAQDR